MKERNFAKRLLALIMSLVMIIGVMPTSVFAETESGVSAVENTENNGTVSTIIAMSDYQNSSLSSEGKKTVPQTIVNAMVSAGVTPELALIGGDYTDGSVGADGDDQSQANLRTELGNLTNILTSAWSNLPYYAIQGNHDYSGFLTDGTLDATGAYEKDNYIVYLINEDSFPWWQGNYGSGSSTSEDKATVTATTNALSTYLDGLISVGEKRPVIIMSHVPMHWSERSTAANWYYDNIYANILFDALNEKAKELDILFLFGHNHSSTASGRDYDCEIGGALSYVAKGESMKVPNGTDGTSNYTTETLNFTYMNAGYVGKYAGNISDCSISAITIDSDSIDIARYTYSGDVYNKTIALTAENTGTDDSGSGDTEIDNNDTTEDGSEESNSTIDNNATGNWITIPGTPATTSTGKFYHVTEELVAGEIYLLVSNDSYLKGIQDTGVTYSKTTSGDAITYNTTIDLQTMTTSSDSEGDYIETTDESLMWKAVESSIDGYFYLQNVATGAYLRAGYSLDDTYGRNINTTSSTSDTYTSFKAVSGSNYGIYAVESSNATSSYRFVRYSNSNTWYQGRTSYQSGAAQLWKAETTVSSEGTPDTYARLTGETNQSYDTSEATSVGGVLGKLSIETSTDGSTVAETVSVTSDMVTWDKSFNGSSIGTYTGTVTYEEQTLGTVTVNVTGTAEEVEGDGNWIALPSGYVYTLDTDGMDPGSDNKYIIVGSNGDYALTLSGSTIGSAKVTVSGDTVTLTVDNPSIYEFYFQDNSSNESGSYLLTQDGARTIYHSGGNLYYGSDNKGYWHIVTGSEGEYRVYDTDNQNWHLNYGYVWGSDTTDGFSVSSNQRYVRLYKYTGGSTDGSNGYVRLTGTIEQVYSNADATTEATVLGKVSIQTSTDGSTVASTVAVTSDMVTWDTEFNGSVAGVYTGTVKYEGQTLGTIKVTVLPVSVEKIELITAEGSVIRGSKSNAITGGKILVTYSDGTTAERDVVLGMLNNDGKTEGTYTGLTVTYGGKTVEGFTLKVNPKSGNNFPEYPDGGSVDVNKIIGDYSQFQNTGVAEVQLSTSGIPMNEGVDVVVVLDTSSSMQETVEGFSSNRLTILRPAVNSLIEQLQTKREDGSNPDLDIAIVAFNGFTGNGNSNTTYGSDNYIEEQAYATPNNGGWLTDKSGDGWVDIMDLSTTWATENEGGNITTGSGTNYDEGLLMAYELLAAKQEAWGDEEVRQQYVVFMSDGAPFQYNGVYSNFTSAEWNNWLLGNYETEDDIPDTVTNKEYYTGYTAGKGQLHRIAEAIKGDSEQEYQIVTTTADTDGKTELKKVNGLGAILYSIGYLLADNGQVTNETQDIVLENLASGSEYYFDVDNVDELDNAFTNIASAVKMAATNAYFVDQMGDKFDIQMASKVTKFAGTADETIITLTPVPQITVSTYNIYSKNDVGTTINDVTVTLDMVGQRYGSATVVETVTFNAAGTEAYSNDGTTNIISEGVICATNFFYNTTAETKTITLADGSKYDLPAETFYWNIGTINEKEFVLSYYVYLVGSAEGTAEAGTYNTNNYATLYYTNWLENNVNQSVQSPTLAWESASVYYGFYLVGKEDGKPVVNQTTGETGSFADAVKVTQRIFYNEVLLNSDEAVATISVDTTSVPDGYTVYDPGAVYTITVDSANKISGWVIENDKEPDTTYVTDYRGTEVTNIKDSDELASQNGVDYTSTTVWFAVVWEPQTIPDTVVIDYGLPVDISVLVNDMFGNYGTLIGVGLTSPLTNDAKYQAEESEFGTSLNGKYGTASVLGSEVRYTPINMQMESYDQFFYEVKYTVEGNSENLQYYYGQVTVIPATTIYYEDNYVTVNDGTVVADTENEKKYGIWTQEGKVISDATQAEDRPGEYNLPSVDANNVYGYDQSYDSCSTYSLGSALKVSVSAINNPNNGGAWPTAEFTFAGTGFDIISLTSGITGFVNVQVYKVSDGSLYKNWVVDTYYGYVYNETTKEWVVTTNADTLYQIPIIKGEGFAYGTYKVIITPMYAAALDNANRGYYDIYVDAIRIYDPVNLDTENDTVVEDAYEEDAEANPYYMELRNLLLNAGTFDTANSDTVNGIVFVDGYGETSDLTEYANVGPNNEVYLKNGEAIAFHIWATAKPETLQLGVKLAQGTRGVLSLGNTVNAEMATKEFSSATDMYYEITQHISLELDETDGIYKTKYPVIITNISTDAKSIVSLTNLKWTFETNADNNAKGAGESSQQVATLSLMSDVETAPMTYAAVRRMIIPEPEIFEPEVFEATWSSNTIVEGQEVVLNVVTSDDVAYISVNDEIITTGIVDETNGTITWSYTITAEEVGTYTYSVVAYNANDVDCEPIETSIIVTDVQTAVETAVKETLKQVFSWISSWFGR